MRHARVVTEARRVQHLGSAAGAQPEERLEGSEIRDVDDLPQIALDIRRHVVCEPCVRCELAVVNARITARPEDGRKIRRRGVKPADLGLGAWQCVNDGRSPGETLTDRWAQREIFGAGENEASRLGVCVHESL